MKSSSVVVSVVILAASLAGNSTFALAPFKKAFEAKYIKDCGDEDFQVAFKKAGCYTCHVKGEKKDVLNGYGFELSKLVDGSAKDRIDAAGKNGSDAKAAEQDKLLKEFEAALQKVEAEKAPSGQTFGELFKGHELPTADGAQSIRN